MSAQLALGMPSKGQLKRAQQGRSLLDEFSAVHHVDLVDLRIDGVAMDSLRKQETHPLLEIALLKSMSGELSVGRHPDWWFVAAQTAM